MEREREQRREKERNEKKGWRKGKCEERKSFAVTVRTLKLLTVFLDEFGHGLFLALG